MSRLSSRFANNLGVGIIERIVMPDPKNILSEIPAALPDELIEVVAVSEAVRVERIVSLGHSSPEGFWFDQETDEWVLLVKGAARLRFEGDDRPVTMQPGDYLNIPAQRRHRVEWTDPQQPTVWLAVHYGILATSAHLILSRTLTDSGSVGQMLVWGQ